MTSENPILLFDGVCNLCSGAVQFIIEHDTAAQFRFASLQSPFAQALLVQYHLADKKMDSVILIYQGKAYLYADAPLQVAMLLGGWWKLAYVFKIIPSTLRNVIYKWIARNRYAWFGKKTACWIPTPSLKARFLG